MIASSALQIIALAFDGVRRKKVRGLLTMAGVVIGVFALTTIVALGEGMTGILQSTLATEENLRQIEVAPGAGGARVKPSEIVIEGEMSEERRARLKRTAIRHAMPRGPRGMAGGLARLDDKALETIRALPHVETVEPIVNQRFRVTFAEAKLDRAQSAVGVPMASDVLARRLVAGTWFGGPDDAVVHEYLLYQLGYRTEAEQAAVVGQSILLARPRGKGDGGGLEAQMLSAMAMGSLPDTVTPEERDVLMGVVAKVMADRPPPGEQQQEPPPGQPFRIVGIYRDLMPTDEFRSEDSLTMMADLLLPAPTAEQMLRARPSFADRGFSRLRVTVDDSAHAREVEEALRDLGYTAFGVASMIESVNSTLGVLTALISLLTGIALLVAALGIINTMITSVLERTREIGLWKAVGATNGQVRLIFLCEAGMIGLLGGLMGLGLAALAMVPAETLASNWIATETGFPIKGSIFQIPLWLALAGPGIATIVAMIASVQPASRAAAIDPVQALRHE